MYQRIRITDDAKVKLWYMASCRLCGTDVSQPFEDRESRDAWAKEHENGTAPDHKVQVFTEIVVKTD